jgi:hypothetical protein
MSDLREALDAMVIAFAEGVCWSTEQRAAYEKAATALAAQPEAVEAFGWYEPVVGQTGGSLIERFKKGCKKPFGWTKHAVPLFTTPPFALDERMRRALPKRPDSIYSKFHLNNWSDNDFARHAKATRKTLRYLVDLEEALSGAADASNAGAEAITNLQPENKSND